MDPSTSLPARLLAAPDVAHMSDIGAAARTELTDALDKLGEIASAPCRIASTRPLWTLSMEPYGFGATLETTLLRRTETTRLVLIGKRVVTFETTLLANETDPMLRSPHQHDPERLRQGAGDDEVRAAALRLVGFWRHHLTRLADTGEYGAERTRDAAIAAAAASMAPARAARMTAIQVHAPLPWAPPLIEVFGTGIPIAPIDPSWLGDLDVRVPTHMHLSATRPRDGLHLGMRRTATRVHYDQVGVMEAIRATAAMAAA
jgi:hypothetical protein